MKKAMIIAGAILFTACTQPEPQPVTQQPPSPPKRYRVIQDGKISGYDLELVTDQYSSSTFRTRDGRKVVYHGSYHYEELPNGDDK